MGSAAEKRAAIAITMDMFAEPRTPGLLGIPTIDESA